MSRSDWIALVACLAAVLALVPAYSGMLQLRRQRKGRKLAAAQEKQSDQAAGSEDMRQPGALMRALVCISMTLLVGVAEVVVFSWIASMYGVEVEPKSMPTNWLIVFYGMFLLPGYFLFLAAAHLSTVME
jgi:hypothetical protein